MKKREREKVKIGRITKEKGKKLTRGRQPKI